MKLVKWLKEKLTPQSVIDNPYRPAEVEAIGFNAVAEALNVSPTLEGGWPGPGEPEPMEVGKAYPLHMEFGVPNRVDRLQVNNDGSAGFMPSIDEQAKNAIELNNGPARMVMPNGDDIRAPGLLERHSELAAQAIEKFSAEETRLIEAIKSAEEKHAEHIAGLRAELADTRTALRFYRTGPDMLKRRPERVAPAAKPKSKQRRPKTTRLVKTPAPTRDLKPRKSRAKNKPVPAPDVPPAPVPREPVELAS